MDPSLQSFWEEFQSESDEHVATADRLLEQARSEPLGREEISELFRAFHSLKGLAHAMDLSGLEQVAHVAESLLGLVRDRGVALDNELLRGLGAGVDQLGRMLAEIGRDRSDVEAPPELLEQLDALLAARSGEVAPAPAPAPAAPERDDPPDSGMGMVQLLAELLDGFLPGIAAMADPAIEPDAAAGLVDSVTMLRNAADAMEMPEMSEITLGLSAFADGAQPETLETRIALLVRLGRQAALIGEIAGVPSGVAAFTQALAPRLVEPLRDELETLIALAGRVAGDGDPAALPPFASSADSAGALLDAMGHPRSSRLLALAGNAASSAGRGEVQVSSALTTAIGTAVAAVSLAWADPLAAGDDLDESSAAERNAEIRAALTPADEQHATGDDSQIGGIALPATFLPVLSSENRQDLARAIGEGQSVYQIMVDLDALDGQGGDSGATLERLAEIAHTITSRTVPEGDSTWFEFLSVSPLSRSDVKSALAALDPAQAWIKSVRPVGDGKSAEAKAAPKPAEARKATTASDQGTPGEPAVLRVRSASLDRLMAAIGHTRVAAAALSQLLSEDRRKTEAMIGLQRLRERLPAAAAMELGRHLDALRDHGDEIAALDGRLATGLSQLHADALDLRVVPVDTVLGHLPRMARELAQRQGKQIRIRLKGREVRIDKSVVQQLLDPLMHMMRNAVDHGIEPPDARVAAGKPEQATITLRARQRSSEFRLEITDDGRGLDAEAIRAKAVERGLVDEEKSRTLPADRIHRFIFEPGFSTAAAITETSGRGVGMDVVMHTVTRLGGRIDIKTEKGAGTSFTLRLPLSASVLPALVVEVAGQTLAIPERHIVAVEEIGADRVRTAGGRRVLLTGNLALPLHPLSGLLGFNGAGTGAGHAVVVASGASSIALEVDRLQRRQELLLRDLHPALAALPGVGGAALLGDGSPILVLDVDALIELARTGRRKRQERSEAAS